MTDVGSAVTGEQPGQAATFRQAFASGEFRAVFAAHAISTAGDQFARVALSVLVFERTRSAGLTALTYALTFLPDLVGGPLLAGLADRRPRRLVMIAADVLRAVLVAGMAIPAEPLLLVCALLVVVQLAAAPARAARAALLPQILPGELYPVGQAALGTVGQAAQVAGFAGGGALVAAIGPGGVLLADAGTFAVSALLAWRWIRPRPAATASDSQTAGAWWSDLAVGAALVWVDRRLRALVAFACVGGAYIAGEALAAPYAAELGGGPLLVGLLFAAYAAGAATGMPIVARLPEPLRTRLLPPLVVASCLPLVLCAVQPGAAITVAVFVASGLGSAYHVVAQILFVRAVPDRRRGQAYGLASTALMVAQGLGVAVAGAAAEVLTPSLVVALMGAVGVFAALGAARMWRAAGGPPAAVADQPRQQPTASPDLG